MLLVTVIVRQRHFVGNGSPAAMRADKIVDARQRDPVSRAYYERKVSQGKRHNQALIALARRRCDVLFAMLRDRTYYHPVAPRAA